MKDTSCVAGLLLSLLDCHVLTRLGPQKSTTCAEKSPPKKVKVLSPHSCSKRNPAVARALAPSPGMMTGFIQSCSFEPYFFSLLPTLLMWDPQHPCGLPSRRASMICPRRFFSTFWRACRATLTIWWRDACVARGGPWPRIRQWCAAISTLAIRSAPTSVTIRASRSPPTPEEAGWRFSPRCALT